MLQPVIPDGEAMVTQMSLQTRWGSPDLRTTLLASSHAELRHQVGDLELLLVFSLCIKEKTLES